MVFDFFFHPSSSQAKPKHCKTPFLLVFGNLPVNFFIFQRMEILELLWASWPRAEPLSLRFFYHHIQPEFALLQLASRSSQILVIREWSDLTSWQVVIQKKRTRYSPWPPPLQAEQTPLLAHPGSQSSWWFSSEVPLVIQHLFYTGKTQTEHSTPDTVSKALNRGDQSFSSAWWLNSC